MKKIGDAAFFRILDRLLSSGPSRTPVTHWQIDGVDWHRERHSHAGRSHGYSLEVTIGSHAGSPGWILVVVKEFWRGSKGEDLKALQWAQIEKGPRTQVVAWLERQKRRLEAG